MSVSSASITAQPTHSISRYLRFCLNQLSALMEQADLNVRSQLAAVGIPTASEERTRLGWHDYERLIRHLDSTTVLEGAGLEIGRESSIGEFGVLGMLSTCAGTYGQSVQFGVRFAHLLGWDIRPEVRREPRGWKQVRIRSRASGGELSRALIEQWCALVSRTLPPLLPEADLSRAEFHMPFERPRHAAKCESTLRGRVVFSSAFAGLRYPAEWDELLLPEQSSPIAAACLSQLHLMDRTPMTGDALVNNIRTHLAAQVNERLPTMEAVAREIGLSVPTLRRRLADLGLTFEKVVESYRREMARNLLVGSNLQIEQIAAALGYRSPSSFYSAFRDWYGCSPKVYRARCAGLLADGRA
jgi:AraC-like DNA-binding protein